MEDPTLLQFVLAKLKDAKGQRPDIAKATGLDYSWLAKLACERIPDPSVNKIQRLADYFKQKEREA